MINRASVLAYALSIAAIIVAAVAATIWLGQ
jgi:hypothetical protein